MRFMRGRLAYGRPCTLVAVMLAIACGGESTAPSSSNDLAPDAGLPDAGLGEGEDAEQDGIIARDLMLTTLMGEAVTDSFDVDNDSGADLTFVIVSPPDSGTVDLLDTPSNGFRYTPDPGFEGMDEFEYLATAWETSSNVGTVQVGVQSAEAPELSVGLQGGSWIVAGGCGALQIRRLGPVGFQDEAVAVAVTTDLEVYDDAGCSNPVGNVPIAAGATSALIYARKTAAGSYDVQVAVPESSYASGTTQLDVVPGPAATLALGGPVTADRGLCTGPYSLSAKDEYGNPVGTLGAPALLQVGLSGHDFYVRTYSDEICGSPLPTESGPNGTTRYITTANVVEPPRQFWYKMDDDALGSATIHIVILSGGPNGLSGTSRKIFFN